MRSPTRSSAASPILDWINEEWQNLADVDDPHLRRLLELISQSRPIS